MQYCSKCGAQMEDDQVFCSQCGAPVAKEATQTKAEEWNEKIQNLNDTEDTTGEINKEDIEKNKVMAALSYLGILVLIPIFAAKDSKFARYHANQGLVLFIVEVLYSAVYKVFSNVILAISWNLYFIVRILGIVNILFLVLVIIGIVNAVNGRAKELPVIGKFKILK